MRLRRYKNIVGFLLYSGTSLFYLFSPVTDNRAHADQIPAPGEKSMRAIAVKNHIEGPLIEPGSEGKAWVRIGLKITEYENDRTSESGSEKISAIKRHTLRAKLTKTNHFFFGSYHIQTKPIHWNRSDNSYATLISIFHRYGNHQQVEESVGSLKLQGTLKGEDLLFTLHGVNHQIFRNKLKHAVLGVTAGYHSPRKNEEVAAGDPKGEGTKR